jgi:uncharacterized protein (DUF1330 family)
VTDPTREDLDRFLAEDDGQPVVMLNLLRFAPGGEAHYAEYARETATHLAAVGGELVYAGSGGTPLVAEDGQAWDAVLLVRYPSRAAFLGMVSSPGYQAIAHLRSEALAEAVLQPTTGW